MSVATATLETQLIVTWPILPDDFLLPDDPVEDENQPLLAAAMRQPLTAFPELMQDALVVSNFALCAAVSWPSLPDEEPRMICKAPDWMYIKPVKPLKKPKVRRSYTPHTEGEIPPIVVEFISATYGDEYSVEFTDQIGKWYFYEQIIKVPRYVIFRPKTADLEVYELLEGRYQLQAADANHRYWIPGLNLFLGVWQGSYEGKMGNWLRWWNAEGELLLWSSERLLIEQQRAEQERQRAERLAERLRQAGIEINETE